jgi:hypothetical protein
MVIFYYGALVFLDFKADNKEANDGTIRVFLRWTAVVEQVGYGRLSRGWDPLHALQLAGR